MTCHCKSNCIMVHNLQRNIMRFKDCNLTLKFFFPLILNLPSEIRVNILKDKILKVHIKA